MPTNWTTYKKWTRFQQLYNPPKLSQEEIDNLNKPITRSKTETVILKTHYKQKSTGEFYQTYKKELILILLKLFQKIEEEGIPPKFFHEALSP